MTSFPTPLLDTKVFRCPRNYCVQPQSENICLTRETNNRIWQSMESNNDEVEHPKQTVMIFVSGLVLHSTYQLINLTQYFARTNSFHLSKIYRGIIPVPTNVQIIFNRMKSCL